MVLERRQKYNLILSEDEKKLLKGFIQLLEPFELFTIGAQANKYPTINMELLYRIEIEQRLTEIEQRAFLENEYTLSDAVRILKDKLDLRFPITDIAVAAAILDPAVQFLPHINQYLNRNQLTRAELLKRICVSLKISLDNCVSQPPEKRQRSESQSLKAQLIAKHVGQNTQIEINSIESELSLLYSIKDDRDINDFYRDNHTRLPTLAKVANAILLRPITTSKSESAFSTAGHLVNSRRSSIDPLRAEKVLFIHDNYEFINKK